MGVKHLWKILPKVSENPVGKKLAIDASIWLHYYKDIDLNAFKFFTIKRIVKLLYGNNKPVFVFDGSVPLLKKNAVVKRQKLSQNVSQLAKKFLKNETCRVCKISYKHCEHAAMRPEASIVAADAQQIAKLAESKPQNWGRYFDDALSQIETAEFCAKKAPEKLRTLIGLREKRKMPVRMDFDVSADEFSRAQIENLKKRSNVNALIQDIDRRNMQRVMSDCDRLLRLYNPETRNNTNKMYSTDLYDKSSSSAVDLSKKSTSRINKAYFTGSKIRKLKKERTPVKKIDFGFEHESECEKKSEAVDPLDELFGSDDDANRDFTRLNAQNDDKAGNFFKNIDHEDIFMINNSYKQDSNDARGSENSFENFCELESLFEQKLENNVKGIENHINNVEIDHVECEKHYLNPQNDEFVSEDAEIRHLSAIVDPIVAKSNSKTFNDSSYADIREIKAFVRPEIKENRIFASGEQDPEAQKVFIYDTLNRSEEKCILEGGKTIECSHNVPGFPANNDVNIFESEVFDDICMNDDFDENSTSDSTVIDNLEDDGTESTTQSLQDTEDITQDIIVLNTLNMTPCNSQNVVLDNKNDLDEAEITQILTVNTAPELETLSRVIKDILNAFDLPYVTAVLEADSQCAYLNKSGLVDAVVTEDNDIFLYGGLQIYRNYFKKNKSIELYDISSIQKTCTIDDLIKMSVLLGSDYTKGIKGFGMKKTRHYMNVQKEYEKKDALGMLSDSERINYEENKMIIDSIQLSELRNLYYNGPILKVRALEWVPINKEKIISYLDNTIMKKAQKEELIFFINKICEIQALKKP